MKQTLDNALEIVKKAYSGNEFYLWELLMGEQIHIGGFKSSMELATRARIGKGMKGVDFCCCTGAGMRFLIKFRDVSQMVGVDATDAVVEVGKERCRRLGLHDKVKFVIADVCDSGLESGSFDFVWGEDAWCYVEDKQRLIQEAFRLLKPGGIIAFTDWVEGIAGLTGDESDRLLSFMKFPNVQNFAGYQRDLKLAGFDILAAEDTGRFAPYMDLYLRMVDSQLYMDVLRLLDYNLGLFDYFAKEMFFMKELADSGKIAQGLFIAVKR